MHARLLCAALTVPLVAACSSPLARGPLPTGAECRSLTGEPLFPPPLEPQVAREREANLARAREALAAHPDDPDALEWVGRRLGYLGRYREALDVFTFGRSRFPGDPRFARLCSKNVSLRTLASRWVLVNCAFWCI